MLAGVKSDTNVSKRVRYTDTGRYACLYTDGVVASSRSQLREEAATGRHVQEKGFTGVTVSTTRHVTRKITGD